MKPNTFASEAPTLRDLARRGYQHDFNLSGAQQPDGALDMRRYPGRFRIHEVHRFEGASDPEDMCVVYAIESDSGVKGVVVDAYGYYADSQTTELLRGLAVPLP
jgi:hypothetical protein